MKFSSYEEIVLTYIFLKKVVEELNESYFLHMSRGEIKSEKESIINELRTDTSFKVLAKFEADIRTDYNEKIKTRKKDNLSEKYMNLCLEFREKCKEYDKPLEKVCRRVPFDNILEGLKFYFKETGSLLHQECSNIKGSLRFRHWYAHGRYFKHRVPIPDPEDLEIVCNDIINSVINRKEYGRNNIPIWIQQTLKVLETFKVYGEVILSSFLNNNKEQPVCDSRLSAAS